MMVPWKIYRTTKKEVEKTLACNDAAKGSSFDYLLDRLVEHPEADCEVGSLTQVPFQFVFWTRGNSRQNRERTNFITYCQIISSIVVHWLAWRFLEAHLCCKTLDCIAMITSVPVLSCWPSGPLSSTRCSSCAATNLVILGTGTCETGKYRVAEISEWINLFAQEDAGIAWTSADGWEKRAAAWQSFVGSVRIAGVRRRLRSHPFDASVAVVSPSDSLIPTSCTIATLAWHYTTHQPCDKYLQQVRAVLLKERGLSPLGFRLPRSSTLIGCFCCALLVLPSRHSRSSQSPQSPIACAHDHHCHACLRWPIQATLPSSTRINSPFGSFWLQWIQECWQADRCEQCHTHLVRQQYVAFTPTLLTEGCSAGDQLAPKHLRAKKVAICCFFGRCCCPAAIAVKYSRLLFWATAQNASLTVRNRSRRMLSANAKGRNDITGGESGWQQHETTANSVPGDACTWRTLALFWSADFFCPSSDSLMKNAFSKHQHAAGSD